MKIKPGGFRAGIEFQKAYLEHLGVGQIATNGIQYSSVATFGTIAVEILNQLIDPGFSMALKELEVSFVQRFTEVSGGTTAGSLAYLWEAREEYARTGTAGPYISTGNYMPLVGTITKGISSGANVEDTLEGYFPVASLPHAPIRVRLLARSLYADAMTGEVKNNSYIRMVGNVIPGA